MGAAATSAALALFYQLTRPHNPEYLKSKGTCNLLLLHTVVIGLFQHLNFSLLFAVNIGHNWHRVVVPNKEEVLVSQISCTFCGTCSDAAIVQTGFPQTVADAPAVVRRDTLNEKTSLNHSSGEAQRQISSR